VKVVFHFDGSEALRARLEAQGITLCPESDEEAFARLLPEMEVLWHVLKPVTAHVRENEVVPLALIVNELIMNAFKHSPGGGNNPVTVALENGEDYARIIVCNPSGRLPREFDFDAGTGIGTGLSLVKSLLPPDGAVLRFHNETGDGVHGELTLRPPVIGRSS